MNKKKKKSFKARLKEYKKHIALVLMGIIIAVSFNQCEKEKNKENSINDPYKNEYDTNQEVKSFDEILKELQLKFPGLTEEYLYSIDLSNYLGNSLIDALNENGYQSSFEFRKLLASIYGINDYTGTPEQDELILNIIRDKNKDNTDEIIETPVQNPTNTTNTGNKDNNHNNHNNGSSSKPSHDHKMVLINWDEYFEHYKCACGKTSIATHQLDMGTIDANGNTTYKCTHPGCGYEKVVKKDSKPDHDHKMTLIKWDEEFEYYECSCGESEKIAHQLDKGTVDASGNTTYKCTHPGCGYEKVVKKDSKPDHKHKMTLIKWDEKYEYYECSCGETKKTSHKFGDKITKADGSMVYECTNTGCDYEKPHIHVTREDIVPIKSKDVCYEIVVSCKDDDCGELYVTEVDHDYVLLRESVRNEVYGCTVCGREKSVPKKKPDPVEPDPTPVEPDPVTPDPDPVNPEPDKPEEKDPIQSEAETVGYVYTLRPINKR